MKYLLVLLTAFLSIDACNSKKADNNVLQLTDNKVVLFLNKEEAQKAIIKDEMENFFELIGIVDMSIQMKKNFEPGTSRDDVLKEYKQFLQDEVMDFTAEEMEFTKEVFSEIFDASNQVSESIFPKEVKLIKIEGKHYGDLTYYTRENCIVIPRFALSIRNKEAFQGTMLHELFHVYSRLNPDKRKSLYELIGFKKVQSDLLQFKDSLKMRILLNPDGIDYAYQINLTDEQGNTFGAIPMITANQLGYTGNKPDFFNYLNFQLYELEPPFSKYIRVRSKNNGEPLRDLTRSSSFHSQIKDNTGYIIHPDEIMADNFMFLITKELTGSYPRNFSSSGLELLDQVKAIIIN